MNTRRLLCTLWLVSFTIGLNSTAQAEDEPRPLHVTFHNHYLREQKFIRLLKITADQSTTPLNDNTLNALLNCPAVAGDVAKRYLNLDQDQYDRFFTIKIQSSPGLSGLTAQLEIIIRADQRLEQTDLDRLTKALTDNLVKTLEKTAETDHTVFEKRKATLTERRQTLKSEADGLHNQRIQLLERSGLAEVPNNFYQNSITDFLKNKSQYEMELSVKKTQLCHLQEQVSQNPQMTNSTPGEDAVVTELTKLVGIRAAELRAAESAQPVKQEAIRNAQALLAEASTRLAERQDALRKQTPAYQIQELDHQITELQTRLQYCNDATAKAGAKVHELLRHAEEVDQLADQEKATIDRINKLDTELDQVILEMAHTGTVVVTMVGQSDDK